jgi:UDP-N-acetylmuramate--alanine ligase
VLNATAACAMMIEIGETQQDYQMLTWIQGVSRRFEIRYKDDERVLIGDYAHHPEELKAAITAAIETLADRF